MKYLCKQFSTGIMMMSVLFTCCINNDKRKADCVHVLWDKTDTALHDTIKADQLYDFLPVTSTEPLRGAFVRFSLVTQLKHTPSYTASIPAVDALSSNEIERKKDIQEFKDEIETHIRTCKQAPVGYEYSEIFSAIKASIESLAVCADCTGRRVLVVLSDLHQNTPAWSVFDTVKWNALLKNPELIDSLVPVSGSLKGIELYLVHQPGNITDDTLFDGMSQVFNHLEKKGIKVHIVSSLNQ